MTREREDGINKGRIRKGKKRKGEETEEENKRRIKHTVN
jgi:hypothetical protein